MKAGAADGVVLKDPLDDSLGNVYMFMPEWNLRDITDPSSDSLLDLLKHRAEASLFQQYCRGLRSGPGDHAHIVEMMHTENLKHVNSFHNCYTFFTDDDKYGNSYHLVSNIAQTLRAFAPAIQAGLCVPQSTGELILQRQIFLLQSLAIMIDDVLDQGSQSRNREEMQKKSEKATTAALSKLSIQTPTTSPSLPNLIADAHDQADTLQEYLDLLSAEPVVLAHAVNIWFFSRPELIADEKGRVLPMHTDKYISRALFEAIHNAIRGAAIWKYLDSLFELLEKSTGDKVYRSIILQEISNICHLEYDRARANFKRHVQSATGSKCFQRVSNASDKVGNARVTLKIHPEVLTRTDPQLHYMLRLCQSETTPKEAVEWVKKLTDLHNTHPTEREKLFGGEADALCDLAVIVVLIHGLSSATSMPALSRKKGQIFISRSEQLEAELNQHKTEIDLRDYAVPIDNLLEPGMANAALGKLDQFSIETFGSKVGFLYQDLEEDCLAHLDQQYRHLETIRQQAGNSQWTPLPLPAPQPVEKRVEQRRIKEKTRPSQPTTYGIEPRQNMSAAVEPTVPTQTFKVSVSTAEVFSTFFSKSQSRGSVSWVAFEAAMAELGFSIVPKYGLVYTFLTPDIVTVKKSLTVH